MIRSVFKPFRYVGVALAAAVGVPFLIALSAYAQDPGVPPTGPDAGAAAAAGAPAAGAGPGAQAEAERVIVTGSNIPTAEEVGPNPVLNLNRDLIEKSGERSVEQLLKNLTIANSNSVPVQNNATSQAGPAGASSVSLRGFDNSATLVLVDGRRVASYPGSGFIDLNTIPLAAVQSIEILKDGASATYGADAVAGVVNIKLWKEFRGVQTTTTYGNTFDKDAALFSADVLFGIGDGKTSVTGDIFYFHHNSMFNIDRGNSLKPPFLSSNASPYNLQVSRATVLPAIGLPQDPIPNLNPVSNPAFFTDIDPSPGAETFILNAAGLALVGHDPTNFTDRDQADNLADIPANPAVPGSGTRKLVGVGGGGGVFDGFIPNNVFFATAPTNTNGLAPADAFIYSNGRARAAFSLLPGFNFNATSGSFPEQERWGGYTAFSHKVCDEQLQIYGDFYYADVKTHDELAPSATNDFQTEGQGTLAIPPGTNLNGVSPPNTPTYASVGMPPDAVNRFNPFNQIISAGTRARLADFGNRLFDNENEAFLTTLGVKGDKLFDGNWGYDTAFRYSQILNISRTVDVNTFRYNEIVNENSAIFDPDSASFVGTTIPYNPFNDFRNPIASNIPTLNYATLFRKDLSTSKIATLDLNVYTTELFKLPAGGVGFAFGGNFSRSTITLDPDDQGRLQQEAGVGRSPVVQAGRKSFGFYGELLVPFTSPEMGIPGLHSLEFTYSGRYEEFRNNDTNVLVPKFGMRWQPFDDQLTIRSTWGCGFLQPSLFQLYGGTSFTLAATSLLGLIPGGAATPETTEQVDSNPNLQPEDSRAWTGGIVYTPKWIPAGTLTLSVDLWNVERTGVVNTPGAQEVVRRFIDGTLFPGEQVTIDNVSGTVTFLRTSFFNSGRQNARGFDIGIQYQLPTQFGTFTSLTQATYLDSLIVQSTTTQRAREVAGRGNSDPFLGAFFGPVTGGDGWVKWKGVSRLLWSWNNIELGWTLHYFDGFKEKRLPAAFATSGEASIHYVGQTFYQDAQASYEFVFAPPVSSQPVAGYSKDAKEVVRGKDGKAVETGATADYSMPCWKNLVNNTKITLGVNNIFSDDPPKQFGIFQGNSTGYPGAQYDNLGRFLYVELKKKF